jgi:hypothetical protein
VSTDSSHRRASRLPFAAALADAGGAGAPRDRLAGLRAALLDELLAGAQELDLPRSGYGRPVVVGFAVEPAGGAVPAEEGGAGDSLLAVAPVDQALRADPGVVGERGWLLVAAIVGAMVQAVTASAPGRPAGPVGQADAGELGLRAGALGEWLVLALSAGRADDEAAELAVLAFEDEAAGIDRLRARAYALPPAVLDAVADVRPPIGEDHPLRAAEAVARLGGRPADEGSVADHEEAALTMLGARVDAARPHDEQDPSLRVARRILQRLAGMGKWGGYHTDVAHLARGFAGNERALAVEVGERLIGAGLLVAKPSVGQRHVFLNPRRAADIHALIERGVVPKGLELPGP